MGVLADQCRGTSSFVECRNGLLKYRTDDTGLSFTVPANEIGSFYPQMKSILLTKFIKERLKLLD